MQFQEDEEEIHHEVPSDEDVAKNIDPQLKVGPTPVLNVQVQAQQTPQKEHIIPYDRIQQLRALNKQDQEAKSFTNIFRNKQVRPLQKMTTQDNEPENQQNIQHYHINSKPLLHTQQQEYNQQIKQTQQQVQPQQQQYQQQDSNNIQPQQLQQQIPQQQQQRKGLFSNKYDDIKRQKYMRLISTHFANQPDFQEAACQELDEPDIPDSSQQQCQPKSSQRAPQRWDKEEKAKKPRKRVQFQDLPNPDQAPQTQQLKQQNNTKQIQNIEYVQAINFDQEQTLKHICNDKQDQDDIDDCIECFLPQQLQDRVILECREQGLIRIPEQDSLDYPDDEAIIRAEDMYPEAQFDLPTQQQFLPEVSTEFDGNGKRIVPEDQMIRNYTITRANEQSKKNQTAGSHMTVNYPDGSTRPFGKSFKEQQCVIKDPQNQGRYQREFTYGNTSSEFNPGANSFGKYKKENTRVLYDDKNLGALSGKAAQPQKAFKAFKHIVSKYDIPKGKRSWIPIKEITDIPPKFYMTKKFDCPTGLANIDPSTIKTPYDAFRLFFNKEIYEFIVQKTNQRIIQDYEMNLQAFVDGSNPNRPGLPTFRLNEPLLDAYLAAQIYQGMINIKKSQDYWERSKVTRGGISGGGYQLPCLDGYTNKINSFYEDCNPNEDDDNFIAGKMGHILEKGLYDQIKLNLHVSDNKVSEDPLAKVRDFLVMINENFKKHYNPEEFLVVDEGMIPFNGRVKFKVFNPDKPNQWGIKEYLVCDAVRAYTLEVKIYCGDEKSGVANFEEPPDKVMGKTMDMVLSLLSPYQGKQHKVIMDNYYTSPELFSKLKSLQIGAIGTIRHNRTGLSKQDLDDQHFQKIYPPHKEYMSYLSVDNNNILTYFQGTNEKECALLSSFVDTTRNFQHKASIQKNNYRMTPYQTQPFMIYLYNKYRGGCDKRNSFVSVWRSKNRTQKWWKVIFDRLFQTAVTNAAIIMRIIYPEKTTKLGWLKDFRRALMHEMIQKYRDYVMAQDPTKKERWGKSQKMYNSHTLIEGSLEVNCVECGGKTHVMCQECSMMNNCIVGVCKDNEEACQRYHMCAGNGWDVTKAQDPLFSQASQEFMQRNNRRHRGRPSTWATIKQLREYKMQLEIKDEKSSSRTNEYDKAISLLNETLGQLVKQDPDIQISDDLSSLLQQLAEILPETKEFVKMRLKGESTSLGKKEVMKEEKERDKLSAIIDLRDDEVCSKQEKIEKKEHSQKFIVVINLEEDDDPQEEIQVNFCDMHNLSDQRNSQILIENKIKEKQIPQIYSIQQKIHLQNVKKNQQQYNQKDTESGVKKKIKVMGKVCEIINF